MKTLLKRIKLAILAFTEDVDTIGFVHGEINRETEVWFFRKGTPYIVINKGYKDDSYVALPQNMTEEEFADIMSREWEDM